jgi:hypothetical protein
MSLMQIVSYGAPDTTYFMGNDHEVTYFKATYKRHTNFSVAPVHVQIQLITYYVIQVNKKKSCYLKKIKGVKPTNLYKPEKCDLEKIIKMFSNENIIMITDAPDDDLSEY